MFCKEPSAVKLRELKISRRFVRRLPPLLFILCAGFSSSACFNDVEGELYYGRVVVPAAQEFRWSDGGVPRVFDPALAAAAPDTDAVRAMYEGLTEYDPRTLAPVSGVALQWESSEADRVWTFHLRRDARWSNGEQVTAGDFVRSWRRVISLADQAPHAKLLNNIEGARQKRTPNESAQPGGSPPRGTNNESRSGRTGSNTASVSETQFGAVAVDDHILRVRLARPDKSFPALVAHPVFRPVYDGGEVKQSVESFDENASASVSNFVTNGAFVLSSREPEAVVLERARNYWDREAVKLQRVRFVGMRNAEDAIAAYRAGEVDAVSNAAFEPLALKLLLPYRDFRRETFGAVTYYHFNTTRPPFDNLQVRQAFAFALDRNRLSRDVMSGANEPATTFLPRANNGKEGDIKTFEFNPAEARALLKQSGFPEGRGFPVVKLIVNRNDQQRVVAEAVAAMWRSVLRIETEIVVKSWEDYEAIYKAGDYDLVRRSLVMQTTDETTNMLLMFGEEETTDEGGGNEQGTSFAQARDRSSPSEATNENQSVGQSVAPAILSESDALAQLPALPVSFASSYALVKPYVVRFDANLLDAPSLKNVSIDTAWRMPQHDTVIRVQRSR